MKKMFIIAIAAIALCGCAEHAHKNNGADAAHVHLHSFTAYTQNAEFFMQHEGVEVGKKSCITLYATSLENFKPLLCDKATATLKVGQSSLQMASEAHPAGVFHFDIVPDTAGEGMLFFEAGGEKAHFNVCVAKHGEKHAHAGHSHEIHSHSHAHGEHAGHSHETHSHEAHSHSHAHGEHLGHGVATNGKEGDVALAKEQSWAIDFATAVAKESTFGGMVRVVAKVEAVPDNFTTVVATTSGKVQFAGNVVAGMSVSAGDELFYLEGSDVTDNDAAVKFAEAESNYHVAKADYERKKQLFIEKVVAERDYQAAEALYRRAEARFLSMQRNFGGGKVTLKSSMNGYIASLLVANGEYVQPGTPLAIVQRNGNVNIVAELPVRYASVLQRIERVNVELPSGEVRSLDELGGRVLAVGSAVNNCNMLPVVLSAEQAPGVLPGSIVTLYITAHSGEKKSVAVPRSAIVEEMGNLFVFVQNSPVSFEKRPVKVASSDGKLVPLLEGVKAGERVVTKGGIILKLSQGAAALDPHAGHVH